MTTKLKSLFICIALLAGTPAQPAIPIGIIKIFTFNSHSASPPFFDTLMDGSGLQVSSQTGGAEQLARTWFHSEESGFPRMDLLLIHSHFVESHLWTAIGADPSVMLSDSIEPLSIPGLNTVLIDILHGAKGSSNDTVTLPWIMANTIPLFSSELPSGLIPQPGQSAQTVLSTLAAAGYQMIENKLPEGGTISDLNEQIRQIVPQLKIIDTGSAGMGAVQEVARRIAKGEKVFTFFGLHPYGKSSAGIAGIHVYQIDDLLFQAPVVPLVRRDLAPDRKQAVLDLLVHLAAESTQQRAADFRFLQPKEIEAVPAWVSGRIKQLCSTFKIIENVPLVFSFELNDNGGLLCKGGPNGPSAEGEIPCEPSLTNAGWLDCFAKDAQTGVQFLAIQINPESSSPSNMGKIVNGFAAGGGNGFFIGRGGWTLGCMF